VVTVATMKDNSKMSYRTRFYRHYLSAQLHTDPEQLQERLRHQAPYFRHLIRKWLPQDHNTTILDLGCGYGAFLYFLKEAGYRYLRGIDGSTEQVAAAQQLGLEFVQEGDLLDALRKCDDRSYHVIIAFDILEHFAKHEIANIMDEVHRVLDLGGKLILHVPNGEAIFAGRIHFGDLTHETCFTRQSVCQLMNAVGFRRITVAEDMPIAHGVKSGVRYVLWKVFRVLFRLIYMVETGENGKNLILSQNLIAIAEKG
jgi:SAM-dependent methyltransferase